MQSIQSGNKRNFKKIIIISLCVVATLAVGAFTYVYGLNGAILGWSASDDTRQETTNTDDTSNDTEANGQDNLQSGTIDTGEGKTSDTEGGDTAHNQDTSSTLSASITAASQNGNALQIRTLIKDVVTGGTCTLTLTKGSVKITRTAAIQPLASSSTCQGFDVSTSELTAGTWTITIDISADNKKAHLTKAVTITD